MKKKNIGIIGVEGHYGRWLSKFFKDKGCDVIGSDLDSRISSKDVVDRSEAIIFAVPTHAVVGVINELAPYSRTEQLWMDVTSLKVPALGAMMKSSAEVAGLHPLFAPPEGATWKGGTVVICPERVTTWIRWLYGDFLNETEADLMMMDPVRHDSAMLYVQNLPHAVAIAEASVLIQLGKDAVGLLNIATPVSKYHLGVISWILTQNPEVCADIQMCNPQSVTLINSYIAALERLRDMVANGDRALLIVEFERICQALGKEFLDASAKFFTV